MWVLFPYNRFSRIFAKQYNDDLNLFTHAQIRSTLFLKFLTTSFRTKDCGSLAFQETEESQAARTTLCSHESHELTENVSWVDSDRKGSSEPQGYPCFLTN